MNLARDGDRAKVHFAGRLGDGEISFSSKADRPIQLTIGMEKFLTMKVAKILFTILLICFYPLTLDADIYTWTDENGVKHYSNTAPGQDAKVMEEVQNSGPRETTHKRQYRKVNKNVKKTHRKSSPKGVHNSPLLKRVHDSSVASALTDYNDRMKKIGSKCGRKTNAKKCMCDNMPEIIKANQAKIDAFLGLMRRRPELKNQMVKIDGVFGNWYLDPEDPTIRERNNVNFWKKRYNCK